MVEQGVEIARRCSFRVLNSPALDLNSETVCKCHKIRRAITFVWCVQFWILSVCLLVCTFVCKVKLIFFSRFLKVQQCLSLHELDNNPSLNCVKPLCVVKFKDIYIWDASIEKSHMIPSSFHSAFQKPLSAIKFKLIHMWDSRIFMEK